MAAVPVPNLMGHLFLGIFIAVGVFFLAAWLLQWLWNITMPQVFNLKEITYWKAFRLLLIASLLFGGANFSFG